MKKSNSLYAVVFTFLVISASLGVCQNLQWTGSNPIRVGRITKITQVGDGTFYALSDSGVITSTNNGINWAYTPMRTPINDPKIGQVINGFDAAENGTLYLDKSNYNSGTGAIEISTDKGISWHETYITSTHKYAYVIASGPGGSIFAMTPDPLSTINNPSVSIFRSFNDGNTWDSINISGLSLGDVFDFSVSKYGRIFLSGTNTGYSDDTGKTWHLTSKVMTTTLNVIQIVTATGISNNPSEFFLATNTGVYFSGDTGNTWSSVNTGLFDIQTTGIAIDPRTIDTKENIYVSTLFSGVFASSDKGLNWHQVNNGLSNTYITTLFLSKYNTLYAGSTNRVFRTSSPLSVSKPLVRAIDNFAVTPNPASTKITFSFTLPKEEFTSIKIYNSLGKEAANVVNKILPAGYQPIEFDVSDLPSAVYSCLVQIGGYVEDKQVIVVH